MLNRMYTFFDPITLFLIGLITIMIYIIFHHINNKLPPGPIGWPIVGYTNCLGQNAFYEIMNLKTKYGDIISFRIFGKLIIVLNSYEAIYEAAIKNRGKIGRYTMATFNLLASGLGISNYDSQRALQLRQAVLRHLYGKNTENEDHKVNYFKKQKFVDSEIMKLMEQLRICQGKPITVLPLMRNTIWRIMWNFVFGTKCNLSPQEIDLVLSNVSTNNLQSQFFEIRQLLPQPWINFLKNISFLRQTLGLDELMKRYEQTTQIVNREVMISLKNQDDSNPSLLKLLWTDTKLNLAQNEIKRLAYELMAAGTDTTSLTLTWACDYIARSQQTGGFVFNEKHLDMIHRWASVVPLALPHVAKETFRLKNYLIPEESVIIYNLYAVHNQQIKDLFTCESGRIDNVNHMEPIPFSLGSRSCPGYRLANKFIENILSSITSEFTIQPALPNPFEGFSPASHKSLSPIGLTRVPHKSMYTFITRINVNRRMSI